MKTIAVTQRVDLVDKHAERRDCLDQRWTLFLSCCKLLPILIPNNVSMAQTILKHLKIDGLLLTNGNSLSHLGGNAPERDATENMLLKYAIENGLPVFGVCRGMQLIQHYFGAKLTPVMGHICETQSIIFQNKDILVNSYHNFGTNLAVSELETIAHAKDGVIKAVKHKNYPISAIMWHPERFFQFRTEDINMFSQHFGTYD